MSTTMGKSASLSQPSQFQIQQIIAFQNNNFFTTTGILKKLFQAKTPPSMVDNLDNEAKPTLEKNLSKTWKP